MEDQSSNTVLLTGEIVANYVANNQVAIEDLPALIRTINTTLNALGAPQKAPEPEVDMPTAAQIKKSIRPDGLVSFIDGKSYKTLKRHLSRNGLTIAEYKTKFGLPGTYPTTSPEYSIRRSEMARSLGLGRKAAVSAEVAKPTRKVPVKKGPA